MRNPLTSMLHLTILIIVKEILSVGTGVLIEATMVEVGTTTIRIYIGLQRTIHPGKAVIKNQYVITVWVHIT